MLLEHPALKLTVGVQDIINIIEALLREKNWKKFELMNFKLVYTPMYVFNYDVLMEQDVQGQTYSQGFSGTMALNAVNSKLEPVVTEILEKQPVEYEKDISHDFEYELEKPAITRDELKDTCQIKMAGKFNVGKEAIAASGFRLIYWPVWRVFVTLPKRIQKINIEAVSGYTLNIEEVPEKEKTWMQVTEETIDLLKTPEGWMKLSKSAASMAASGLRRGASAAAEGAAKTTESRSLSGLLHWLLHNRNGQYTLLALILLIFILFFMR